MANIVFVFRNNVKNRLIRPLNYKIKINQRKNRDKIRYICTEKRLSHNENDNIDRCHTLVVGAVARHKSSFCEGRNIPIGTCGQFSGIASPWNRLRFP